MKSPLYALYERRLLSRLPADRLPKHVGVILDGNRRWALNQGNSTEVGHLAGARHIKEFLEWCDEVEIPLVTLWLLSTENLHRPEKQLAALVEIINETIVELAATNKWRLKLVGSIDLLPDSMRGVITKAEAETATNPGMVVNIAVGYGGRQEVVDAVKSLLIERDTKGETLSSVAATLNADEISRHLYTGGQPDPDLVIRTSGEQRLSGFLMWQSTYSEFWFCEAYWPDFRRVDFLRALRDYAQRKRRFGV
jgi:short-chain Z-isoprenyl diphosphate synthase